MPSKSEKQRKFFGAVMGAKKGKGKVTGAAKKVAKEMPEKKIKKFLKTESYDAVVNSYLKKYLIEMDVRQDPREGFGGDPFIDTTEEMEPLEVSPEEMFKAVANVIGQQKASMLSGDEVKEYYNLIQDVGGDYPTEDEEKNEEDCESAHQGCTCDGCAQCSANKEKSPEQGSSPMLTFYGMQ